MLLEAGALTSDQYARAVADRFGLDHVDLTVFKADLGALNLITAQAAKRFSAVPIGFDDGGALMVAMVDPSNVLALDDLKLMTGHEVKPVVASYEDVTTLIGRMNRLSDAVAEAIEEEEEEEGLTDVSDIRESADDAPVIKLVNSIVAQAVEEGASDVHFENRGGDMRVRQRIDGVLQETTDDPASGWSRAWSRASRSWATSTSPRSACPRTAACRSRSRGATWTSASSRCRRRTARAPSCACSTRTRR